MHEIRPFATGLWFAECPAGTTARCSCPTCGTTWWTRSKHGAHHEVVRLPDAEDPGGLGFLPDGRLVVVGMEGRCVYGLDGAARPRSRRPPPFAPYKCNDMVVGPTAPRYVSQHGFDTSDLGGFAPTQLCGCTRRPGRRRRRRLPAQPGGAERRRVGPRRRRAVRVEDDVLDAGANADLVRRGTWTLPATGGAAFRARRHLLRLRGRVVGAHVQGDRLLRFAADGTVTETIVRDTHPLAVVLGGPDRRTLYICAGEHTVKARRSSDRLARIDWMTVDVPGDGVPDVGATSTPPRTRRARRADQSSDPNRRADASKRWVIDGSPSPSRPPGTRCVLGGVGATTDAPPVAERPRARSPPGPVRRARRSDRTRSHLPCSMARRSTSPVASRGRRVWDCSIIPCADSPSHV